MNHHQYQFESLKNYIDTNMMLYGEGRGIYPLNADIENRFILFEERDNFVVLCCDKLKDISGANIYKAIPSVSKTTVICPFTESAEERDLLLSVGAEKVDFQNSYCQEFGSFDLKYTGDFNAI